MENSMTVPLSEGQMFFAMVLQMCFVIWLIVFPVLLIRKLNYLIAIIEDKFYQDNESQSE